MNITEKMVDDIHNEIKDFLKTLEGKYGISFTGVRCRYNSSKITYTLEGKALGANDEIKLSAAEENAARWALGSQGNNIQGSIIGKRVKVPGLGAPGIGEGTIVDFSKRSPKYPFVVENDMGTLFKVAGSDITLI